MRIFTRKFQISFFYLPISNLELNYFQSLTINSSGYIGTYLIIGGVDKYGPHLYEVAAHGSTSKLPFCAMGSGTLPAMSVLEASRSEF